MVRLCPTCPPLDPPGLVVGLVEVEVLREEVVRAEVTDALVLLLPSLPPPPQPAIAAARRVAASAATSGAIARAPSVRRSRDPSGTSLITHFLLPSASKLDLSDPLRRDSGRDHARRQVLHHHRVRADDAALADLDAARHHAVRAEPAVRADPHRALGGEALPRDGLRRVVEPMRRVAHEAGVGEHDVVTDLDTVEGGEHHVPVEETALADLDSRLRRKGEPAARLEQCALADLESALVQRLEHLALDGKPDECAGVSHVAVDPPAAAPGPLSPVPTPPDPPPPPTPPVPPPRAQPPASCRRPALSPRPPAPPLA